MICYQLSNNSVCRAASKVAEDEVICTLWNWRCLLPGGILIVTLHKYKYSTSCPLSALSFYPFRLKSYWKQPGLEESPSKYSLVSSFDMLPGQGHALDLPVSKSYIRLLPTERPEQPSLPFLDLLTSAREPCDDLREILCYPLCRRCCDTKY